MEVSVYPESQCPCQILNNDPATNTITILPPGANCPCQILNELGKGYIIIGSNNTHPLTSGEEFFITIRTYSFHGLQSSPVFIVQSVYPKSVIATNNRIEGGMAKFEVEFQPGGIGSINKLVIRGAELNVHDEDRQFRLDVRVSGL